MAQPNWDCVYLPLCEPGLHKVWAVWHKKLELALHWKRYHQNGCHCIQDPLHNLSHHRLPTELKCLVHNLHCGCYGDCVCVRLFYQRLWYFVNSNFIATDNSYAHTMLWAILWWQEQRIPAQMGTALPGGVSSVSFLCSDTFQTTASPDSNTLGWRWMPLSIAFTRNLLY
jgi:hypothetical protein